MILIEILIDRHMSRVIFQYSLKLVFNYLILCADNFPMGIVFNSDILF